MKDDSLSFFGHFSQTIILGRKRESKIKNKNNCQTKFFNCFIFKNYFQINLKKLFCKKNTHTHPNTPIITCFLSDDFSFKFKSGCKNITRRYKILNTI